MSELKKPDITKPAFQLPIFKVYAMRAQLGWCTVCSEPIDEKAFTSSLSKREYTISGMCQKCQDKMFD